ncbi:hypothetical protein AB0A91_06260 [Streptomyces sp. NPDC042207]|uniref:hypothetical protein n=1 Tax=Streptomyces sp. NPDC042207 TaxID=3154331 RepID=UPI0033F4CF44
MHSNCLLIEGTYAGHVGTKWTFTGSHNLDCSSLRDNDETLLSSRTSPQMERHRARRVVLEGERAL